eukprot:TRINITY_DN531_c0_g2_i2.p1 TRINITY_DN531_c0_g2~~TRINITY_DN531_c0_g2_i2.p1  ORF type:complete len:550 (-),score=151.43 TRINITY_DN531_c0_g2_i2:312-1868(-)
MAVETAAPAKKVEEQEAPSKAEEAGDEAADAEELPVGIEVDGDIEDGDEEVLEHLKDSVEGSFRLKRLLTREDDDDGSPASKKKRVTAWSGPEGEAKVNVLLKKWDLIGDALTIHVLDQMTNQELDEMDASGFILDKWNQMKTPCELLARHMGEVRERKMIGGGALDAIAIFRHTHGIAMDKDKILRSLNHKDLRYVFEKFDGTKSIDDLVEEAKATEVRDENRTEDAVPTAQGLLAYSRFGRLELIDPLADCAVFGDANLTFALKLAKHRKVLGHVGRVIATTFEDLDTLRQRYQEIDESIATLEKDFAEVYHSVDCTRIAVNPKFHGLEGSLGAVYYNFPHSGAIGGFYDGHPVVNWRHENLMRLFFRALRSFVKPGGCVKVASNMGAVGVRYSYIVGGATENEFQHVETFPFLDWCLHRYGRSYGDRRDAYRRPDATNNQSYNAQNANRDMVYSFRYAPSGKDLLPQTVRLPPTLRTLEQCEDGPFRNTYGKGRKDMAEQLHKRFVSEVSGIHVG